MPKKRLIYADDFLDLFYVASAEQDKSFISTVEMVVSDTPTVDAEPVRHGRWKLETKRIASCSSCGMLRDVETQTAWCYCPNCGAKMRGDVDAAD